VPKVVLLGLDLLAALVMGIGPSVIAAVASIPAPVVDQTRWVTRGLLAGGVIVIPAAAVALLVPATQRIAFRIHAAGGLVLAATLLAWATSIVLRGTPRGVGFSWSPGILTFACAYAVYVTRRSLPDDQVRASKPLFYSHLVAAVVVCPIDFAVMFRIIFDFMARSHQWSA
jgi:hypothetical protein